MRGIKGSKHCFMKGVILHIKLKGRKCRLTYKQTVWPMHTNNPLDREKSDIEIVQTSIFWLNLAYWHLSFGCTTHLTGFSNLSIPKLDLCAGDNILRLTSSPNKQRLNWTTKGSRTLLIRIQLLCSDKYLSSCKNRFTSAWQKLHFASINPYISISVVSKWASIFASLFILTYRNSQQCFSHVGRIILGKPVLSNESHLFLVNIAFATKESSDETAHMGNLATHSQRLHVDVGCCLFIVRICSHCFWGFVLGHCFV